MISAVLLEIKFAALFFLLGSSTGSLSMNILIEASKNAPLYTKTPKSHQTQLVSVLNMFTYFHVISKSNTSYFGSQ